MSSPKSPSFWVLAVGSVGVVYGDIGTSPLYAMHEALGAATGASGTSGAVPTEAVYGVASLIIWALILVVTVKYVVILLNADNKGEGGTLSLMALAQRVMRSRLGFIPVLAMIGAALFYGDAMITPAISVLSAIEGLKVVTPAFEPYVLPITVGIIIGLFMVQAARLKAGLELTRDYMHSKGITFGCEPGGILSKPVQDGVNAVFSSPDMPFRWSFIVDGKSMVAAYADDAEVIVQSEKLASWYGGMTSLAPKQAKLFADGAIYSLAMQVRKPFLDGHKGEWMMDEDVFNRAFRIYWDAGYQIHIHVNGDAGLDRVLGALETNLRRHPRYDHRTVLVHFAVSDPDQVARIKALGAIVSGNPYYVTALADQYSKVGLGPQRADEMVRLGDLTRSGIRWSLHSDMPMAPADPLFLMWCAVNRETTSGRVAGPGQRVTAEQALRGVTIEAAYSLKLEDEIGTISPGKRANFTILSDNPLAVDPGKLREIAVWGTVMEARLLPVSASQKKASFDQPAGQPTSDELSFAEAAIGHAFRVSHGPE